MTTRIEVDAHWDVEVTLARAAVPYGFTLEKVLVKAGEKKDFYIYEGLRIAGIVELKYGEG